MIDYRVSTVLSLVLAAAGPAAAADIAATSAPASDSVVAPAGQEIVVTGTRRRSDDVLGDVKVLGGQDLTNQLRATLGETLAHQPGVTTSGSGPNVARPVLRGLSGDRLRILTDGIGALDVSASSSDHAVAINPLTADSIEVLHGPAALLYGSSAIGGVVNVIDSRIPRRMPEAPLHVQGIGGFGSAANQIIANGEVDVPLGSHIVVHGDANYTHNDDLRTGGYILSAPLRGQAAASADPEIQSLATLKGKLPNSDGRGFEAAGSVAYIDGALNIGVSVTRHTANYGVPIRYSLDPDIEADQTHIDVHQTRYDARAEIPLSGLFKQLRLRGGYSDYNHKEIGADGGIGSQIFSKGTEGRADLVQRDTGGWGGISGVQYLDVRQRIAGDEQFLPPTHQKTYGLFTVQHIDAGSLRLEAGVRYEHSDLRATASSVVGNPDLQRKYSTLSLSAGGTYALGDGWKLGLNLARSQRAPSIDELYANGPHGGNASYERGNPDLGIERSVGFEASIRHNSGPIDLTATAYGSHFGNFLYQAPTGEVIDDLPVYEFRQGSARYVGLEVEADVRLGEAGGIKWGLEGIADATRVTIKNVGPASLIPPLRLQGALTAKRGPVNARIEVEHSFAQRRNAALELPTDGFTLVNAGLDWHPLKAQPDLTLSLSANNIFDVEARRSTSLLKDYAPLAGRDFRVTARFSY
ncbi:TonB-dependent receptor [Sphingomonas sp.]|uniref:TonB-dependent receptor n=1 Tax=Sphingomonas sp. TaxID=28214 RepID=UPI00286CA279|nr:TonB-dependent receptor [Sphingomonas sp.]